MVLEENIRSIREALGVASPAEMKDNPSATNGDNEEGSSAWGNHLDALGDKGQNLHDVNIFGIPFRHYPFAMILLLVLVLCF